jgi:polyhydroxyalkanoate synthesis regulator phasin
VSKKTTEGTKVLPQEILDSAHRVWLAGLGALASAEEEGSRLFKQLVDRGRELEGKSRSGLRGAGAKVRSQAEDLGDALDSRVSSVLHRMGVPTRDEIHELTRRVEELNAKVDRLRAAPAGGGARRAAKKAGAPVATKAPKKG